MTIDIGVLVVSEREPSGNINTDPSMADWLWFEPSTGRWHQYNTGTSSWEAADVPSHLHPTLGDINFIGTISVNGYAGHSERVTIGDKKLTFKEGLCVAVEDI